MKSQLCEKPSSRVSHPFVVGVAIAADTRHDESSSGRHKAYEEEDGGVDDDIGEGESDGST